MSRDCGRAQVYAAENVVAQALAAETPVDFYGSTLTLPIERRFASIESVQAYVDAALAHGPVRARWPRLGPVQVIRTRGRKSAWYRAGEIHVPDGWAMRETVIIHELAHHVVRWAYPLSVASHGAEFRQVHAALTGMLIGPEAELLLSHAYVGLAA